MTIKKGRSIGIFFKHMLVFILVILAFAQTVGFKICVVSVRTFEVSLFAELFNEMLMRDSAYKLYRALTDLTPEVAAMTTAQNAESADKKDKTGGGAAESEAGGDGEEESAPASSATTSSAAGATPAAKVKMVTRNKELLMACSYFDLGHGGYIEKKDVEDILQVSSTEST